MRCEITELTQHSDPISRVLSSSSNDPYFNLALEEVLVREQSQHGTLLFYRNIPSLVLGKHQNMAEEVDLEAAREREVAIARRISGGGTVFHDPGNLNIAVVTPYDRSNHNDYHYFLDPIISALASFGIVARFDNRNSLVLESGEKISGSAQFVSRGSMLSHATLLVDADLEMLRSLLVPTMNVVESNAVESVRSRVRNIGSSLPDGTTIVDLCSVIAREFGLPDTVSFAAPSEDLVGAAELLAGQKYATWEWIVARSPRFSFIPPGGSSEVVVENGLLPSGSGSGDRFAPWIGTEDVSMTTMRRHQ